MYTTLFTCYALAHLGILVGLVTLLRRGPVPGGLILAFVAAGLIYDNAAIALGSRIGIGTLLETLSWPRFALHAVFTPFVMIAAARISQTAGALWLTSRGIRIALWAVVLGMALYGVFFDLIGLELQPACLGETLRYSSSTPPPQFCAPEQIQLPGHGPPIPSIVTVIVCLILGFDLWRRAAWPWLFAAALLMFVAAAIPASTQSPTFSNGGEILLQAGLALSAWRFGPFSRGP